MTCPGGCVKGGGQPLDPSVRVACNGSALFADYKNRFGIG